ncbi:MAG: hypothetical protein KDJ38_19860, partial [Gammaproteobacteria bacterium]|nr:hypothetical protein [Gammaproteobacteria bacterium]
MKSRLLSSGGRMDFFFGRQQDRFNYSKFVSGNDARFRAVAAVLLCLIIPQTLQAADHPDIDGVELCKGVVDRIYFTGNETTRESVFRQEMQIREGEPCSLESISESRQNIMDLGIFSSVSVSLTRYTGRLVLRFDVKEKHFVLPIPRLSRTSSGEIRLGGQLRMDNVAGLNHRLKLTSERQAEDDGAGRKGFEHNFEYEIPRIQNTRYGLKLRLERLDKQYQLKRDGIDYGE